MSVPILLLNRIMTLFIEFSLFLLLLLVLDLCALDVALFTEPVCDLRNALLDGILVGLDCDLGAQRLLIRCRDASELLDLASAGLFIQTLGVALLSHLEGHVDKDLDKGDGLVAVLVGLGVQLSRKIAVGAVGRDEGGDGDGGRVGKELGDLTDAADVLVAVGLGEAQVLVEAEAHVVAVEAVGGEAQVEEVLLQGGGDGGLARGGEARQPDCEAALAAQLVALAAGEGGMPGDVTVER